MNVKKYNPRKGGKSEYMVNDASLIFKNFSGQSGQYPGSRSVNVIIDEESAEKLSAEGLPVYIKDRDDGSKAYSVRLNTKIDKYPPTIECALPNGDIIEIDPEEIGSLDSLSLINVDVVWTYSYGSGKPVAYLSKIRYEVKPSLLSPDAAEYYEQEW